MNPLSVVNITSEDIEYNNLWSVIKWALLGLSLLSIGMLCTFVPWYILFPLSFLFIMLVVLPIRFEWSIYLLVFLIIIDPSQLGFFFRSSWSVEQTDYIPIYLPIVIFSFGGLVLTKLARIKTFFVKNPLWLPIWILFIHASISLSWSSNIKHSMFQLFLLGINFILFYLGLYAIDNEKFHKKVIWCWIISGIICGLIAIALYFVKGPKLSFGFEPWENIIFKLRLWTGPTKGGQAIRRASSLCGDKNLALFMNTVLAFSFGLLLIETNRFKKWLLIIILVFVTSINLLVMSRAGTGALLVMAFFFFLALQRLRKLFFILYPLFLLGVFSIFILENMALVALFMPKTETPRLIGRITAEENVEGQAPARIEMWKKGFDKLEDTSYLLGAGIGNYIDYAHVPHAHSIYFSYLFNFGIIGLGIIFLIIIIIFRCFLPLLEFQTSYLQIMCVATISGLVSILVHGLVDFGYNIPPIIWFYLGIVMATLNLTQQELDANKRVKKER